MSDTFTPFELRVLNEACARDPASEVALRQLKSAKFKSRDRTGHGLFVHFDVGEGVGLVDPDGRILRGSNQLFLQHPDLEHGADAIVWADNGILNCLETYVFGDATWPNGDEDQFQIAVVE